MQFNIIKDKGDMFIQVMKKVDSQPQINHELSYEYQLIYPIQNMNEEQKILTIKNSQNINEQIENNEQQHHYVFLADKNQNFEVYDITDKQSILKFHIEDNKKGKFIYTDNKLMLLLSSDATIITTTGEFDVSEILSQKGKYYLAIIQLIPQKEQPARVYKTIELDFVPTHFTCSKNIIAIYQKMKLNLFKLHIIKYNQNSNKITTYGQIIISRRCKTLAIDNDDVVIITKGKKESYWFQRFSDNAPGAQQQNPSPIMSLDQSSVQELNTISSKHINSTISNVTNEVSQSNKLPTTIKSQTSEYLIFDNQIEFNNLLVLNKLPLLNDEQFTQTSKLEYQFRTLILGQNSLLCGRFDTYLLMQKKRNPQNCILHGQFIQYTTTEKVACGVSDNGYVTVSVDPMQLGLNVYLNYQFYKFLQSSSNGKIFKEKFYDVCILNGRIIGLAYKKIIDFGNICDIVAQINVSHEENVQNVQIQSFILNKEMNQMIIQRKLNNQDQLVYLSCLTDIEVKTANIVKQDDILLMNQDQNQQEQKTQDVNVQVSPQQAMQEFSYEQKIIQFARTEENRLNVYWREETGQLMCGILNLESVV